jgi:hypothetical protein
MRCYTQQHHHYCAIDLHARSMYVCILDQAGTLLVHEHVGATPKPSGALSPLTARMWLSPWSVSSLGMGWRTSVRRKGGPLSWGLRSI